MSPRESILLHVCCAPCATSVVERLQRENYCITLFSSNSNIYPREEYEKRLAEARKIASIYSLELIEDPYDHDAWLAHVRGLENEPERGRRCMACFGYNLGRTLTVARQRGIEHFTTTLSVSRFKSSSDIFIAGSTLPGFLAIDFKKRGGYDRSILLARHLQLYRQGYCGCEFSRILVP